MDIISEGTDVLKILPEAAKELCTALFRNSPAGIYITHDGKFVYTNIEFRRITGYSQDELFGKDYLRLIIPRYRNMSKQSVALLFEEEGTDISHEFKITTREGKKKWISEKITYFKYGGNWLTLGHWLDVSEHHSVKKAWREAERRFQLTFEDIAMGLCIISTDGIFLKVNKSFCDMLGFAEDEMLESHFDEVLCPEDRAAWGELITLFLSQEKPEVPLQIRLRCKDGRITWTAINISLIGDNETGPSYFIVNFQDITEQKRREEAYREEERLYRSLVDLLSESVAVADLDCYFTYISLSFVNLLEYESSQDLLGKKIGSIVKEEAAQQVESQILTFLKQGEPGNIRQEILKRDGSTLPVTMHIAWINKDNGTPLCIVLSIHPATEQKPPEKQPQISAIVPVSTSQKAIEVVADITAPASEEVAKASLASSQPAPDKVETPALASALENTSTALVLLDQNTIIQACNTAFEVLSGFTRKEVEGKKSWLDFVAKEDQRRVKRYYLLRRLDPPSSPSTYEFKFVTRDSSIRDVLVNISPVAGSKNLVATLLDLAEYKQAVAGKQEDSQFATVPEIGGNEIMMTPTPGIYSEVLEVLPCAVAITELDGTIIFASQNAFERMGVSRAEPLSGKNLRNIIRPGLLEDINEAMTRLKDTGFMPDTEFDFLKYDGHILNCEMSGALIGKDDEPRRLVFVIRDISQHKQEDEGLTEQERKYHLIAEKSPEAMWLTDLELNLLWNNQILRRMLGYAPEEAFSTSLQAHLLPDSIIRVRQFYTSNDLRAGTSGLPPIYKTELQFYRKDSSVMWTECAFSLIEDEQAGVMGLIGIAHDISDCKQAEEQANRSIAQLDKTLNGTLTAIVKIVEMRDPNTAGHQDRVARLAVAIARESNLPENVVKGIEIAARIHDIGKVYVPTEILNKPGALTEVEQQIMQSHAQGGYDILKSIDFPWPVAETVHQHHERLDGSGYPRGLKGEEITPEARILMVADVIEDMTSRRPSHPGYGLDVALDELVSKSGTLYDSAVVGHCVKLFREGYFSFNDNSGFSSDK